MPLTVKIVRFVRDGRPTNIGIQETGGPTSPRYRMLDQTQFTQSMGVFGGGLVPVAIITEAWSFVAAATASQTDPTWMNGIYSIAIDTVIRTFEMGTGKDVFKEFVAKPHGFL